MIIGLVFHLSLKHHAIIMRSGMSGGKKIKNSQLKSYELKSDSKGNRTPPKKPIFPVVDRFLSFDFDYL